MQRLVAPTPPTDDATATLCGGVKMVKSVEHSDLSGVRDTVVTKIMARHTRHPSCSENLILEYSMYSTVGTRNPGALVPLALPARRPNLQYSIYSTNPAGVSSSGHPVPSGFVQ